MQILMNAGDGMQASQALEEHLRSKLNGCERRFGDRLTRVEAHLKDANAGKGGVDTSCVLEAHPAGMDVVAVEADADDAYTATHAAAKKLERALEHRVGRLQARHPGT